MKLPRSLVAVSSC